MSSWIPGLLSGLNILLNALQFRWLNLRRGKLQVARPRSYSISLGSPPGLVIQLPLIFLNTGAAPIIVHNLRLIFLDAPSQPLTFQATVDALNTDKGREWARQFLVNGRDSVSLICQFQRRPGGPLQGGRHYPMDLQAQLGENQKWQRVLAFPLNATKTPLPTMQGLLIPYDNAAD
jgi:hypothetical protein